MSKIVRTWYVTVRTSILLGKYVLLASSTYFYHDFCTQYVLSTVTYCFRKVRTWYYVQWKISTYLVRTWGKKYVPVQSSTRWYSTIDHLEPWPTRYRRFIRYRTLRYRIKLRYRIHYIRYRDLMLRYRVRYRVLKKHTIS